MPLTLCTLSLICSMCSFLCATFDNHLLRQSPIVSKQPLHIHTYIYVCVCVISIIQKPKKKKNLVQLYEYSNSNLLHRIVQRSINSKKKMTGKKNEIIIHLRLSLSLLFGRIDAALTLLVTSVLLLTSTLTIGKTTVVTMAAMVTRLVWSKYDPTYNRVR